MTRVDQPLAPVQTRPMPPTCGSLDDLKAWRQERIDEEDGLLFLGLPDRWFEAPGPKFRCVNGHVSSSVLKSEGLGRDACLACCGVVALTFPEDSE